MVKYYLQYVKINMMKMVKKASSKKNVIIALLAVVIVAGAGLSYWQFVYKPNQAKKAAEKQAQEWKPNTINYGPPTDKEKQEAQANKDALVQSNAEKTKPTPVTNQKKPVTPVITAANQNSNQVTVTAYTPTIFENGGKCTMTATKGSKKVTKTNDAFANATTTDCAPFLMQRSDFPESGDWNITVSYNSSTAEGTSQAKTLTIQ